MDDGFKKLESQMQKIWGKLKEELAKISIGRADASLVKDIKVEAYGTETPLVQLAAITVPEPREILIQPWDKNIIQAIGKTLTASSLDLSVSFDSEKVKVTLSPLTEEKREELVRLAKSKTEQARIGLRALREEEWKKVQKQERDGNISEDDKFRLKDELQELVDDYNKKLEELFLAKEKNIKGE